MDWMTTITFDQIALSALAVCLIRETMIRVLPDAVAGPGGWLVNTGDD